MDFEKYFRELLVAAYSTGPGFSVEETAAKGHGHAGDYLMKWGQHCILWELKNFSQPVPTAEVEKFYRDLAENPQCNIGVLVSRSSTIIGKFSFGGPSKHIEFKEGKMLLYINCFDEYLSPASSSSTNSTSSNSSSTLIGGSHLGVLQDLMILFKLFWHSSKDIDSDQTMETAVRTVEKMLQDAATARIAWRQHKSRMDDATRWMSAQIDSNEERLQHTLLTLQGTSVLTPLPPLPPNVFRDVTGEQRSIEYIRSIMELCEIGSPSTDYVALNDLAYAISEKTNLGKATVKSHLRGLLTDQALAPRKGPDPARVLGLKLKASSPLRTVVMKGTAEDDD